MPRYLSWVITISVIMLIFSFIVIKPIFPSLAASSAATKNAGTTPLTSKCEDKSMSSCPTIGTGYNSIRGATAISFNNIWVIRGYQDNNNVSQSLIEHWNGKIWSIDLSTNIGLKASAFNGIAAISSNNVWVVGSIASQSLIKHWNGKKWQFVYCPNIGTLNDITAISAKDIWVTGQQTEHWNGRKWSIALNAGALNKLSVV